MFKIHCDIYVSTYLGINILIISYRLVVLKYEYFDFIVIKRKPKVKNIITIHYFKSL
jgi:hypothetical protein